MLAPVTVVTGFLFLYSWTRERTMLAEFGLGRLPARPPLDYLVTTGAEALVWSLDLIMLLGLVVLALTVVGGFRALAGADGGLSCSCW